MHKYIAGILLLLYSCSPQKRLNRLLDKYPELKSDTTITITDSIVTPHWQYDTVVKTSTDTITLIKDNVIVKLVNHHDSIFVQVIQKPDTIIKELKVPYRTIKYITQPDNKCWWFFVLGFFVGIVAFILSITLLIRR